MIRMSDRINRWLDYLSVLSSCQRLVFDSVVGNSDKELLICVAECFVNIGNLRVGLAEEEVGFFQERILAVEELCELGRGEAEEERRTLRRHFHLVQRGLRAVLASLPPPV